jgi:hypothetical protein
MGDGTYETGLVGLKGPDEMPSDVVGEDCGLLRHLLGPILTEVPMACLVQSADVGHGFRLGYGNQRDLGWCPATTMGGVPDPVENLLIAHGSHPIVANRAEV